MDRSAPPETATTVRVPSGGVLLEGEIRVPKGAQGLVLFAHGSGSGRKSSRNQFVARALEAAGLGTLLFDLLTEREEAVDDRTGHLRFDIGFLAGRLADATRFAVEHPDARGLRPGFFGASTGGGAALVAAARLGDEVGAVVSRGGRPDLAGDALPEVVSPTLLIVGGLDGPVIGMNEEAYEQLRCERRLEIVPGATHLFQEPGTLEKVAELASGWFVEHLGSGR